MIIFFLQKKKKKQEINSTTELSVTCDNLTIWKRQINEVCEVREKLCARDLVVW